MAYGKNKMVKKSFTLEEAKEIGEKIGIDWDNCKWTIEEFKRGMDIELEHGTVDPQTNVTDDDPIKTAKITLAHLKEVRDYNTRLDKMEEEGESYWEEQDKKED